uniref:Vespid allergen antigen homolog n=1 Tax=Onchocerca volvulus TaxID=6282 RepID=O44931_ONCVO|nr:vespid allergen antigen homolog [Onchocerca volvulus]
MILFIIFPAIIVAVTGHDCHRGKLTSLQRDIIVDEHNKYRSRLVKGNFANKDGNLMPKGKNMMEMEWDCELEISAQNWADQCIFGYSPENQREGVGENIYALGLPKDVEVFNTSAALFAIESWWTELIRSYRNNPSNKLTSSVASQDVLHFTQMAWGKTHKVGCGIAMHCDDGEAFIVVCHYAPRGNTIGELIYEQGSPCKVNKHCRTKKCSRKSGLCRK